MHIFYRGMKQLHSTRCWTHSLHFSEKTHSLHLTEKQSGK